ncbi:MAG: sugar phosphate isomerase/epimerase family protein [Planctomycetota bacterium]
MNSVSDDQIRKVLGPNGIKELEELCAWLLGTTDASETQRKWTGRMAPSIITRSEAALFSLSIPRFALRVYLDAEEKSFVNCRRIGEFCDQARRWVKRQSRNHLGKGRLADVAVRALAELRRPAWVLRKNSCLADCLLSLPSDVERRKNYKIIKASLGTAYGESPALVGTPYVHQIKLSGGGLCAQAACFMATALLHDHTEGVWGVAEVTVLGTPPTTSESPGSDPREYLLQGLTQSGIVDYFLSDYVKLNAIWMQALPGSTSEGDGAATKEAQLWIETKPLASAMKAYIASSCPLILPLDMGRMAGIPSPRCDLRTESIYAANGLDRKHCLADPNEAHQRRHAVVAVGYCTDSEGKDVFLLNDPASRPFLKANAGQIGDSAFYETDDLSSVMQGRFLAITPKKVKMPLVGWRPRSKLDRPDTYPGLLRLAMILQTRFLPNTGTDLPMCLSPEARARFRLSTVDGILAGPLDNDTLDEPIQEALRKCTEDLVRRFAPEHWCWVQVADGSIWVWNAEKAMPYKETISPELARKYLMGVWQFDSQGCQRVYLADAVPPAAPTHPAIPEVLDDRTQADEGPREVRQSLITSFATRGVDDALKNWPDKVRYADIYCFMQSDIEALLPAKRLGLRLAVLNQTMRWVHWVRLWDFARRPGWQLFTNRKRKVGRLTRLEAWKRASKPFEVWPEAIVTTLERLSAYATAPRKVRTVCQWLDGRAKAKDVRILGLTTFFPEVVAAGAKGRHVTRALRFLTDVCERLQRLNHPAHTIEIVSGGLIHGVWPAKWHSHRHSGGEESLVGIDRKQELYAATSIGTEQALRSLLGRIRPIRQRALDANVQFAVELEPGPLCVLRDWDSLKLFCELLEDSGDYSDLSPLVGLNLDCAHYAMAQITSEKVFTEPAVRDRIVHVHLADHGRGHFGDVALGRIHPEEHFANWLRLVPALVCERSQSMPKFLGGLSIEMEACRDMEDIGDSLAKLERLIAAIPWSPGTSEEAGL